VGSSLQSSLRKILTSDLEGAFSTAFSASLAGMLWRDILERKHIHVQSLEFCRVNLRIIAVAMVVGCTVLIGEIYVIRSTEPYTAPSHNG
jgi:Na+/H+ antiporter NhaD/arsenite permease-like protein